MADASPPKEHRKEKSLEEQLQDERTLRRFTEQVLDCRQMEVEIAEAEKKRLLDKIDRLTKESLEMKAQLRVREKSLQDAGDYIFRLQPHRQDITESEALEAYRTLCNKVTRFVENRLPATLEAVSANQVKKPSAQDASRFLALIRDPGRRSLALRHGEEYHLVSAIMFYLWKTFFNRSFYCPLDESGTHSTLSWLGAIEVTMAKTRDVERCREWRSETLAAVTSQKHFKAIRDSYLCCISKQLADDLTVVFPRLSMADLQSSLRKSIIHPAAELAHSLQLSANVYMLKWPLKTASSRLEVYECIDLAGGGTAMDLSGTSPNSSTRRHTKYLFDIAPGLFVERVEGGKKSALKVICRPKVLIHAGEGEVPLRSSTLMTWLHNAANG